MGHATSDDLNRKANALARGAVKTGTAVPVTFHGKPYVRIVPEGMWQEALAALQHEREKDGGALTAV